MHRKLLLPAQWYLIGIPAVGRLKSPPRIKIVSPLGSRYMSPVPLVVKVKSVLLAVVIAVTWLRVDSISNVVPLRSKSLPAEYVVFVSVLVSTQGTLTTA